MQIPLKIKILSGVLVLLLLAIGTILGYTNDLILNDKRAYIFENALNHGSVITKDLIDMTEKYSKRIKILDKLENVSEENFFNLLGPRAVIFQRISHIKERNLKMASEDFFKKTGVKFKHSLEEALKTDFSSLVDSSSNKLKVVSTTEMTTFPSMTLVFALDDNEKAVLVLDGEVMDTIVKSDNLFNTTIISNKGEDFFTQKKNDNLFDLLSRQKSERGVITHKLADSQEVLLGFIKLPTLGLNIFSHVPTEKAFNVTDILFEKTIYFGSSLLFLFFILGLFFSITLSRPISSLTMATTRVSEGDFTIPVEVKTRDEFKILGESFNHMMGTINSLLLEKQDMIDELNIANAKLEDYSKNLETMVEQRTEELRKANSFLEAMINSLDQGLVVFGEDHLCKDVFTQASVELFGIEPKDKDFIELIGKSAQKESLEKWMGVLFSEMIPFNSAKGLGPASIQHGSNHHSGDFKHISLDYYPMRKEDGKIENIVTVATDKTGEIIAKEESKEKESFVNMVLKLTHNKEQFFSFLEEIDEIMKNIDRVLGEAKEDPSKMNYETLLISYHTMNGGFGLFSVSKIQAHARSIEQKILDLKKSDKTPREIYKEVEEAAMSMEVLLEEFKESLVNVFGKKLEFVKNKLEIDIKDINKFKDVLLEYSQPEIIKKYEEMFVYTSVGNLFSGYSDLVESMSMKLNKQMYPLKITNGDIRVPPEKYRNFFSTLVHLFRNCMDHGIENNSKREELGKDPKGLISIDFNLGQDEPRTLEVIVKDDGGGIDPEVIKSKLNEKSGLDHSHINDNEIIYKIFDPEFSTRDEVSEFSGRGVGMSAIKEIIDEKGGEIVLESQVGVGSTFKFILPYS